MPFEWLKGFHQDMEKAPDYAAKTLAAYRLGMKAKGSIRAVRIEIDPEGCAASRTLDPAAEYHPDDAPHLPLPACPKGGHCRCVYRPVMAYEAQATTDRRPPTTARGTTNDERRTTNDEPLTTDN